MRLSNRLSLLHLKQVFQTKINQLYLNAQLDSDPVGRFLLRLF